jgi:hypothetical protein
MKKTKIKGSKKWKKTKYLFFKTKKNEKAHLFLFWFPIAMEFHHLHNVTGGASMSPWHAQHDDCNQNNMIK